MSVFMKKKKKKKETKKKDPITRVYEVKPIELLQAIGTENKILFIISLSIGKNFNL